MNLMRRCNACGNRLLSDHLYCARCGALAMDSEAQSTGHTALANEFHPSDELIWEGTYSWKSAIWPVVWTGLASLALLIARHVQPDPEFNLWSALTIPMLWALLCVWIVYRKLDVTYTLTSHRLRHRHGILRRQVQQLDVIDIDDLVLEQGLMEWCLGVGSIQIMSSDASHPRLRLVGIDQAPRIFELLEKVRRHERRRFGLHVEMI